MRRLKLDPRRSNAQNHTALCGMVVVLSLVVWIGSPLDVSGQASKAQNQSKPLESVRGTGCYSYGDNETPAQAKRAATIIAQEQAVRSYRVFVQSSSTVKNFQLEEDLIHTASAAMLEQIQVEKEEKKGQEICVTITAKLSSVSFEELIQQRVNAMQIAQAAQAPLMPQSPGYSLKVWINKSDGHYVEEDRLIVYVQAERDAFLKLDYFQADGCVVHLVPNVYRGQAFIKGGLTYTFGADSDPEHIAITTPFGAETVKAMLSASPIEIQSDNAIRGCDDSRNYLRRLESGLKKSVRGAKLTGVDQSVALVTTSKVVEEYKKDRKTNPSDMSR